jgi:hypothetical protein
MVDIFQQLNENQKNDYINNFNSLEFSMLMVKNSIALESVLKSLEITIKS